MPAPTPLPLRQAIVRCHQRGQAASDIAHALGLSERTVYHLLSRFCQLGESAIVPAYHHGDRCRTKVAQRLRDEALRLRREHPTWGAGLICIFLARQFRRADVPTERTLQRWFRQVGLGSAPKGRRPTSPDARARRPHDIWQIDAKELVRLRSG